MSGAGPIPVVVAYGTRPEAIKLAPIVRSLRRSRTIEPIVAVSGQHRQMLRPVNELFGIIPEVDLDIIKPGQTLTEITSNALNGYSAAFSELKPRLVVVQGDTTTTLSASLAAFYQKIPVVHVEAGLRTGNPLAPFPEEVNRRLTTQLASLHLAPTPLNRRNLRREGVPANSIRVTGNTVIDAFLEIAARPATIDNPRIEDAIREHRRIVVVTAHRRESWGEPMRAIGRAVAQIAHRHPDVLVVLPAHSNPVVREMLLPPVTGLTNVVVVEPMDYAPFCALIAASVLVLTDSGGIQEEAPSLGKPVLVLRDVTERPEAVRAGTVELVGTDESRIVERTSRLLDRRRAYRAMARAVNPYGDGAAAERCTAAIESLLGVGKALADFQPRSIRRPHYRWAVWDSNPQPTD